MDIDRYAVQSELEFTFADQESEEQVYVGIFFSIRISVYPLMIVFL